MSTILHRSQRARLEREDDGSHVFVSPKGNRYPLSVESSVEVRSCAAVWLELSAGQLEMFLTPEAS